MRIPLIGALVLLAAGALLALSFWDRSASDPTVHGHDAGLVSSAGDVARERSEGVPDGVPLHWVLRAKGYRLQSGDETDIRSEGDRRVIEASLVRGWGQIFKVTTRRRDPIAGVELLADGKLAGITDAQGIVSLDLDAKPRDLEFRYQGWQVSWGRVDPAAEGFGWGPETPVYLSPAD